MESPANKKVKLRNKRCFVPLCTNTSYKTPEILFFPVPKNAVLRTRWIEIVEKSSGKKTKIKSIMSGLDCCEKHFNLDTDVDRWEDYNVRAERVEEVVKLKGNVVPHLFAGETMSTQKVKLHKSGNIEKKTLGLDNTAEIPSFSMDSAPNRNDKILSMLQSAGPQCNILFIESQCKTVGTLSFTFPCLICDKKFCSKQMLNIHAQEIHTTEPTDNTYEMFWSCSVCKRRKKDNVLSYESHFYDAHQINVVLNLKYRNVLKNINNKNIKCHIQQVNKCSMCSENFVSDDLYKYHMYKIHHVKCNEGNIPRKFKTLICHTYHTISPSFDNCVEISGRVRCIYCSASFWDIKNCIQHVQTFHNNILKHDNITSDSVMFYCTVCEKIMYHMLDFVQHTHAATKKDKNINSIVFNICKLLEVKHLPLKIKTCKESMKMCDSDICKEMAICKYNETKNMTKKTNISKPDNIPLVVPEYKCNSCELYFSSSSDYDAHIIQVHNNILALNYLVTTKNYKLYINRTQVADYNNKLYNFDCFEKTVYICLECSSEFGLKSQCEIHVEKIHGMKKSYPKDPTKYIEQSKPLFKCKGCGCQTTLSCTEHKCDKSLVKHNAVAIDTCIYICTHCNQDLKTKLAVDRHVDKYGKMVRSCIKLIVCTLYKCLSCCTVSNLHHVMNTHKCKPIKQTEINSFHKQQHEIHNYLTSSFIDKPESFSDFRIISLQSKLRAVREKHEVGCKAINYTCSLCQAGFQQHSSIVKHVELNHESTQLSCCVNSLYLTCEENKYNFYCDTCKIPFAYFRIFSAHIEEVHSIHVFQAPESCNFIYGCFTCVLKFPSLAMLISHMQTCDAGMQQLQFQNVLHKTRLYHQWFKTRYSNQSFKHRKTSCCKCKVNICSQLRFKNHICRRKRYNKNYQKLNSVLCKKSLSQITSQYRYKKSIQFMNLIHHLGNLQAIPNDSCNQKSIGMKNMYKCVVCLEHFNDPYQCKIHIFNKHFPLIEHESFTRRTNSTTSNLYCNTSQRKVCESSKEIEIDSERNFVTSDEITITYTTKLYSCQICNSPGTFNKATLVEHLWSHHGIHISDDTNSKDDANKEVTPSADMSSQFKCRYCEHQFESLSLLTIHCKESIVACAYSIEKNEIFKCKICDSIFSTYELAENHIKMTKECSHGKLVCFKYNVFVCKFCNMSYRKRPNLVNHMNTEHHITLGKGKKGCKIIQDTTTNIPNTVPTVEIDMNSIYNTENKEQSVDMNHINEDPVAASSHIEIKSIIEIDEEYSLHIKCEDTDEVNHMDLNSSNLMKVERMECEESNCQEIETVDIKIEPDIDFEFNTDLNSEYSTQIEVDPLALFEDEK